MKHKIDDWFSGIVTVAVCVASMSVLLAVALAAF